MKEKKDLILSLRGSLPKSFAKKLPREVKLVEVSTQESGKLNLVYRGKKKAANVLSFRYGPGYGEILVCPEIIRQEARKQGHSYKHQMTWMIVHGMIHLAGLHHENSRALARKSELIERKILGKISFDL